MAIFKTLKQYVRFLGILKFDKPHAQAIRIVLNIIVFVGVCGAFLTTTAHLFLEKNSSLEKQVQSGAAAVSYLYCIVLAITIWNEKQQLFDMIDDIESQIEDRERKYGRTIYKEAIASVETLTIGLIIFLHVILTTVMGILPAMAVSYYNYYVRDMGEASFIESVPSK